MSITHDWAKIEVDGGPLWVSRDAYMVDGVRIRFTPLEARKKAAELGGRLPTPRELDARWFGTGFHNIPHPLDPATKGDTKHSGLIDQDLADYEALFGETFEWIVGNVGKCWVDVAIGGARALYGWHYDKHTRDLARGIPVHADATPGNDEAVVIQRAGDSNHNDAHSDYSMTGVFARDTEPEEWVEIGADGYVTRCRRITTSPPPISSAPDTEPDTTPPWLKPELEPRERQLAWALHHEGHAETGPNTSPLIDAWAEHCVRDGRSMGFLWTEHVGADWCAVFASAACVETALDGDPPMPPPRISMSERKADAIAAGTFVPLEDILSGAVDLLPGWQLLWPRFDPGTTRITWRGHVDIFVGWADREAGTAETIGGNVANKVTRKVRCLLNGELSCYGAVRIPDRGELGEETPPPMPSAPGYIEGLDVAFYQEPDRCDYDVLARRFEWLIAKATQGVGKDPDFPEHIRRARAAGMAVGAYHFFVVDIPWSAQADAFSAACEAAGYGVSGDIVPALDLEVYRGFSAESYNDAGRKLAREMAIRFGAPPMIYTNLNTLALMGYPEWVDAYPLWLASQTTKDKPTGPERWSIWQHDATRVEGCTVDIDVNRARELPRIP